LLQEQINRAQKYNLKLSIIIFDIDDFRHKNSLYGEDICNIAILQLASLVGASLKGDEIFARRGDDEFVILLDGVPLSKAFEKGEFLRKVISEHNFENVDKVTCSFGVVELDCGEDFEAFIHRAALMLKKAKDSGKNCVKTDTELEEKLKKEIYEREQEILLKQFELLNIKKESLDFYLFYKELPVKNKIDIIEVDLKGHTITVAINKKKLGLLHRVRSCYFTHPTFSKTIQAKIKYIDDKKGETTLFMLSQVSLAPTNRKTLRVIPNGEMPIKLYLFDTLLKGLVLDVSVNSISIRVDDVENIMLGMDIRVSFPIKEKEEIFLNCRILKIFRDEDIEHYKVVLTILHSKDTENPLIEYLSKRQMDIIKEIGSLVY